MTVKQEQCVKHNKSVFEPCSRHSHCGECQHQDCGSGKFFPHLLNESSLSAYSAILSMVLSTGTLVKSEYTSYDTKMSSSLISISCSTSANRKMSLIVWPLKDRGFLASHPATLQAFNCTFPWLIVLGAWLTSSCEFLEDRRDVRVLNPSGLLNPQWLWAESFMQPRITPSPSEVMDGSTSGVFVIFSVSQGLRV